MGSCCVKSGSSRNAAHSKYAVNEDQSDREQSIGGRQKNAKREGDVEQFIGDKANGGPDVTAVMEWDGEDGVEVQPLARKSSERKAESEGSFALSTSPAPATTTVVTRVFSKPKIDVYGPRRKSLSSGIVIADSPTLPPMQHSTDDDDGLEVLECGDDPHDFSFQYSLTRKGR